MIIVKILLVLLLIITLIIILLLIAPIRLWIDTDLNIYQINWWRLANAKVVAQSNDLLVRIKILTWKKNYSFIEQVAKSSKKEEKSLIPTTARKKKATSTMISRKNARRFRRILKSFDVSDFRLNFDTRDFILNSWLYPVFYFFQWFGANISVNYQGIFQAKIKVQNRLYKVLIAAFF